MTDQEILDINKFTRVFVKASDYQYFGWIVCAGKKRSGKVRVVVEDDNGRWFIHNPSQLTNMENPR